MSSDIRILYVPAGISFDAQMERAHKLIDNGYAERVLVHSHAFTAPCGPTLGCKQLTDSDGTCTVEPVSQNETSSPTT